MALSTSRALSSPSNRGLSTPAWPTSASTAVPPRAGLGTVATGWQATRASAAAIAAARTCRLREVMRLYVREDDRADQEGRREHPGRPVDLSLQPATGAVAAAQPVAATADGAAQPRGLGCLYKHACHQQHRKNHLGEDERVVDLLHGWLFIPGRYRSPVEGVEPRGDIVRPPVLVFQVVGVLPHVHAEDRGEVVHVRAVLVWIRLDRSEEHTSELQSP